MLSFRRHTLLKHALPVAAACAAIAIPVRAEEPIVITNDDLPETLSVSVIGPAQSESASAWPSLEEIAAIAKLNDDARKSFAESRRLAEERSNREEEEQFVDDYRGYLPIGYPWYRGYDHRYGRGGHDGHGREGRRLGAKHRSPQHLRDALPPPQQGWVARPSKHLAPAARPHQSQRFQSPARSRLRGSPRTR